MKNSKVSGIPGGAEGSRTPDLLIANETLYQLSYDPTNPAATNRLQDSMKISVEFVPMQPINDKKSRRGGL